jgi:hypothetical protein
MINFNAPSKFFFCYFLLFFSSILFAQNTFQSGSYIDQTGIKHEGFIMDLDWENSPTRIEFRDTQEGVSRFIDASYIKEFEITGYCKYIQYNGLIDVSTEGFGGSNLNGNPDWKPVSVLLKVLVESDASLFSYSTNEYTRFFYGVKSKEIKTQQLVYKEYYLDTSETQLTANFHFRQQLSNDLVCDSNNNAVLSKLRYNKKELVKYFIDYNKCAGAVVSETNKSSLAHNKSKINYSLIIGVSTANFEISKGINSSGYFSNKFSNMFTIPFGGEIEFILPINNNKWALYFQPTYQSFSDEETVIGEYRPYTSKLDFKSINLPIGMRHYMFLKNKDSKMFLNAAAGFNVDLGSEIMLLNQTDFIFNTLVLGFNFGAGYVLNNRYSFELRYNYSSSLIDSVYLKSNSNTLGLVFKYKLNK